MTYEFDPGATLISEGDMKEAQTSVEGPRSAREFDAQARTNTRIDAFFLTLISVLAAFICVRYEVMEWLMEFAASYERYEIDEIFALLIILSLAFGVFSWRRVLDLREQIASRNAAEARMRHLAMHDTLTGLPNRTLFARRLNQEIARAERDKTRVAVLALDLDAFKQINDFYGHGVGDALLVATGERINDLVRRMDTVARLGGDEFAIIQPGLDGPDPAAALASRIVRALAEPFEVEGHKLVMSVSIGITLSSRKRVHPVELLRAADVAMYRSKTEGRSTYTFFEADMDTQLRNRRELEQNLRQAIHRNEFEVHYQPLYSVPEQRLNGFEALLRWKHPTRGEIGPDEFIPIAEDIGLIPRIGEWVLAEACRTAAAWPEPMRLAVNVSPVQFKEPYLARRIESIARQSGLALNRLEIEITENVLMKDTESVLQILNEIKALGARVAMDDFGTGYSSLSYLRKFPFDKIKIDRSFVGDLEANQEDAAIVRAVVAMGQSLGMTTLAEGVESAEQWSQIADEGCQEAQGFLLGRPMPGDEACKLIGALRDARDNGQAGGRRDERSCGPAVD